MIANIAAFDQESGTFGGRRMMTPTIVMWAHNHDAFWHHKWVTYGAWDREEMLWQGPPRERGTTE